MAGAGHDHELRSLGPGHGLDRVVERNAALIRHDAVDVAVLDEERGDHRPGTR